MANSPKYHELTERVRVRAVCDLEVADKEIRSYLEACATKLADWFEIESNSGKDSIRVQLGLGLGDVEANWSCNGYTHYFNGETMSHPTSKDCPNNPPKETPKQEWCSKDCVMDMSDKGHVHRFKREEWCSHLTWRQGTNENDPNCGVYLFTEEMSKTWKCAVFESWKVCPICGTPRPKSLTKQERLAQYLYHSFTENINGDLFDTERALQAHYMELAGKVLGWVEENR